MKPHKHQTLHDAFELFVRQQNALLPDEETLSTVTLSDGFKQRMQKLLRQQQKGFFVLFGTAGRRIASIAVAVLVAATVTTVSVEALREPVFQFFAEVYEKFTQIFFVDDTPNVSEIQFKKKTPAYIPEGYVVESEMDLETMYRITFSNDNREKIRYTQQDRASIEAIIDTEDVTYENIIIGDRPGITYKNNGFVYIVFTDEEYAYSFSGNSLDTLIEMAQSIK